MTRKTFAAPFAAVSMAVALTLVSGCSSMSATPAAAAATPATAVNGLLVAPTGMTLYTFDKDTVNGGTSACNGPCAATWPPFLAKAGDQPVGDYGIVVRGDGARQWAYKGWPLYTFAKDAKAGDTSGDNFKNIWHVVRN